MGFIKAFSGAIGGTFADQWLDFLTVPQGVAPTAALFPAVPQGQNAGRGSNVAGSANIISNGSKVLVPEGYGLLTFQDGRLTSLVTEPGGFIWSGGAQDSESFFAGDSILSSTLRTSWERFKFGGQPSSQQLALFVSLKEIPNNRFGTQSEIYWDDAYLGAQAGALTRGSYTLRIIDPVLFVQQFVPASYLSAGGPVFDFSDFDNPASTQLFNEVVSSLSAAFSKYTNDPDKGNRITKLQSDSVGFALSLGAAVEENYQWSSARGLAIVKVAIAAVEYDAVTRKLLSDVQKADALGGNRSASFLNQSVARGVEGAGQGGAGGAGLGMFGLGAGMVSGLVQPTTPPASPTPPAPVAQPAPHPQPAPQVPAQPSPVAPAEMSPVDKLRQFKEMLDANLISQEDYDTAKNKVLGL